MSFLRKLFGGGSAPPPPPKLVAEENYDGFVVIATPMAEGGQFRLAGTIRKTTGGEPKEYLFVRADLFPTAEEAARAAIRKARQLIDQQGDRIFAD